MFNVAAFRPLREFKAEVAECGRYLKDTPPAVGSQGVLYPGEVEYAKEQARRQNGVEIEESTWEKLTVLAQEFSLQSKLDM